jgi:streptogramin lyase
VGRNCQTRVIRIRDLKVDHFGSADGLSSDDIYSFYEGREGNLWVATSRGLDNFRDTRVVSFSTREGLSADEVNSVLATRDGSVWIGSSEGLDVLHPGSLSAVSAGREFARNQITSLFEDHAGRLWVGRQSGMLLFSEGRFREIKRADGPSLGLVTGITEDLENNIWVEVIGPPRTLIRIQNFKVQEMFPVPQMPAARKLAADPQAGIGLGLISGDLARLRNGKLDIFSYERKSDSRVDQVFISADGSVLGATAFGLIAWRDGKQQILSPDRPYPHIRKTAVSHRRRNSLRTRF